MQAGRWSARLYPFVTLGAAWVVASITLDVSPLVLPDPQRVLESGLRLSASGKLWSEFATTLARVLTSFLLALLVGSLLGLAMAASPLFHAGLRPLVAYFFPTPKVAVYPALLIVLGVGTGSTVALGFLEALFPVLLATYAAANSVDQRLVWSAQALGTSDRGVVFGIVLRAALPGIMSGARIALVGALAGVFIAELIAGRAGLGHAATVAWRLLVIPEMFVYLIVFALTGFTLDRLFLVIRRRLLFWTAEEDDG
jgi:ABC-type nitrate/sulfonate/bicarbonate transport system permease component